MIRTYILLAVTGLVLAGCQTLEGMGRDFRLMSDKVGQKMERTGEHMAPHDSACPPLIVDPQLDSAAEFYDMRNPTPENEVSRINLTRTQTECTFEGNFMTVRIDLTFEGRLGPKARRVPSDRPFFAYPYYVAVQDNWGTELARELFSASVTYESGQDEIEIVETIRQKLPAGDNGTTPPYNIHVGLQLTEEQLFYNASR